MTDSETRGEDATKAEREQAAEQRATAAAVAPIERDARGYVQREGV